MFRNADEPCFQLYGVFREGDKYRRMPEAVAKTVSEKVHFLHTNTAGGRLRFRTDSPYVAIQAKMDHIGRMPHFSLTGTASFDLYETAEGKQCFIKTFTPPYGMTDGYESLLELGERKMRELTINFPLYSTVNELYIGLDETAEILPASEYCDPLPVVYYGSSITQGGCASRPGCAYQAVVTQMLNCDHINLGFSGSAKGEYEIAEYIASLPMSVFVCDYDANAWSPEHLQETQPRMVHMVRDAHPDLPILMMTRPRAMLNERQQKCHDIIKETYETMRGRGDQNVYFLPGPAMFPGDTFHAATVDNLHPNDLGFWLMAQAVAEILKNILPKT